MTPELKEWSHVALELLQQHKTDQDFFKTKYVKWNHKIKTKTKGIILKCGYCLNY